MKAYLYLPLLLGLISHYSGPEKLPARSTDLSLKSATGEDTTNHMRNLHSPAKERSVIHSVP